MIFVLFSISSTTNKITEIESLCTQSFVYMQLYFSIHAHLQPDKDFLCETQTVGFWLFLCKTEDYTAASYRGIEQ